MKKALNIFSLLMTLVAVVVIVSSYAPVVSSSNAPAPISFNDFPLDQPRIIDFSVHAQAESEDELAALTLNEKLDRQRKHIDQLRDWTLLTLISATGLSARDLNQSVYDLPPLRNDSLRQVSSFEYGETRSRVVGDGQVLALVPTASPEQRADYLAHIADEQRKSLGEIPEKFFIFEYELHPDEDYASITRRQAVDGKELFTEQYGYIESAIQSLSDFEQFITRIDDITFARRSGSSLVIGGRKLRAQPYRGIRTEDVSAIWRSERGLSGFGSSGFSLDPHLDMDAVSKSFDTVIAPYLSQYAGLGPTKIIKLKAVLSEIEQSRATSGEKNTEAFRNASENYFTGALFDACQGEADTDRCLRVVNSINWDYSYQAATYFGELQGTEVGMVLFYTDLLMKLWGLDYMESTPRRMVGFPIQTEMKVSAIYKKEMDELPATRFWLSSLNRGFQVADKGQSIFFARNATSIFARPHDYLLGRDRPDAVEPNVFDRAFVNWWNDHYEEIAAYEPEYQRLNEIMKWSQVVGWLNSAEQGNLLGFLETVPINRTNRFTTWVKQHPQLTFQSWDQIKFYEPNHAGTTTEALEVLNSKEFPFFGEPIRWSGGVSLANRRIFAERAALSKEISVLARRSNLDYGFSNLKTGSRLRTLEATEYSFHNFAAEAAETLAQAKPSARLRGEIGELANVEFKRTINRTTDGLLMRTRAAGTEFGDLRIARTARGYQVGWQSRDIDLGQSLAHRLSTSSHPEKLLLRNPNLENVIKLPGEQAYLIKPAGTENWIKIVAGEGDSLMVAKGYQYRVAGFGDDAKSMHVAWLDDAAVQNELQGQAYLTISRQQASDTSLRMSLSLREAPATAREIQLTSGNNVLKARIDPQTETIYARWTELPAAVRSNPSRIPEILRSGRLELNEESLRLTRELRAKSYGEAARDFVRDPVGFRTRIDQHLAAELRHNNELMLKGQVSAARRQIDELVAVHGDLPELHIRKVLLDLKAGRTERAVATLQEINHGQPRSTQIFFDEINQRLGNQALSIQERNNLCNVARLADWQASGRNAGQLIPEMQGNNLVLKLKVDELAKGRVTELDELTRGNPIIYIQDSPTLNNIDVSASAMTNSLKPLISGNRVTIREVALTDLKHFSPATIYETRTQSLLHLSRTSNLRNEVPTYYHSLNSIVRTSQNSDDEEDEKRKRRRVYVVLESGSPAAHK